eukprot:4728294-Pleurochrysis_carterae.AAC.3
MYFSEVIYDKSNIYYLNQRDHVLCRFSFAYDCARHAPGGEGPHRRAALLRPTSADRNARSSMKMPVTKLQSLGSPYLSESQSSGLRWHILHVSARLPRMLLATVKRESELLEPLRCSL